MINQFANKPFLSPNTQTECPRIAFSAIDDVIHYMQTPLVVNDGLSKNISYWKQYLVDLNVSQKTKYLSTKSET